MKKLKWILFLGVLVSCTKHYDNLPSIGTVQFSMPQMPSSNGGRVKSTGAPAFILLSISDTSNVVVEQDKKLALLAFGSGFTSESLQLKQGQHKVVEFMVLDSANKIIYAAPLADSREAQYVINPLPITFSVTENHTTVVTPQVLSVDGQSDPASFGYANFGFVVIKKLASIKSIEFEYDSLSKIFRTFESRRIFSYKNGLLVQADWYDDDLIVKTDLFEYDMAGRLSLKKTLVNPPDNSSHFLNTTFDYQEEDKITITRFETNGSWVSPKDVTIKIKTDTGFQLVSSDNRKADCVFDENGNMIQEAIDDDLGLRTVTFKYDQSPNPQYFPDDVVDFLDWHQVSKNNVILIGNSNGTVTSIEIQYYSDGYPAVQVTKYANGDRFRLEFEYH